MTGNHHRDPETELKKLRRRFRSVIDRHDRRVVITRWKKRAPYILAGLAAAGAFFAFLWHVAFGFK